MSVAQRVVVNDRSFDRSLTNDVNCPVQSFAGNEIAVARFYQSSFVLAEDKVHPSIEAADDDSIYRLSESRADARPSDDAVEGNSALIAIEIRIRGAERSWESHRRLSSRSYVSERGWGIFAARGCCGERRRRKERRKNRLWWSSEQLEESRYFRRILVRTYARTSTCAIDTIDILSLRPSERCTASD